MKPKRFMDAMRENAAKKTVGGEKERQRQGVCVWSDTLAAAGVKPPSHRSPATQQVALTRGDGVGSTRKSSPPPLPPADVRAGSRWQTAGIPMLTVSLCGVFGV